MPQTPEAEAFLRRVSHLPPGAEAFDALSNALQPSLDDEAELRKLFATDKTNPRLKDIHVGLVDIFDAPQDIRTTRARVPKYEDDLIAKHIMPLSEERRRKDGAPAIVETLDEFKQNWAIFSEGSLSQLLDWNNVVAAGGSAQACLNPVPESAKVSKRALRKHFHTNAYPTSDVDLFLYGLTPEQAEAKIISIYEAVRDSVPWDVTCVRTKHTVSIHSQYPYRAVQIVLRLYTSPAEILAGFDVDAPCCAYDGHRVWANPRAIVAMMQQCNTVDMTRRSPSYEVRLAKYSLRGFEVHVPLLKREDIDPAIFERAVNRIEGLARLLVLEKFMDVDVRTEYLSDRRALRARPEKRYFFFNKKEYVGDLKSAIDIGGLQTNDYDVVSPHIPYGRGWDARRIEKLIFRTDLAMNSPFNPKNNGRRLHRHSAFFGSMEECLEDCCEFCPEPRNDKEKAIQEEEDKSYIRGRIEFIVEDPGRQSISGSFHPIDVGEWAEQAYMGPTEKLFFAIVTNNRVVVSRIISQDGFDLERRDHVGRTPLQIAIMSKAVDIACDLIDAGARITSRIVDGRTTLHLAAQLDLPIIARKLLEQSAVNAQKAKEDAEGAGHMKQTDVNLDSDGEDKEQHDSSEDDWHSDRDEEKSKKAEVKPGADSGQIPEDEKDQPDVFNVNALDWDAHFTPLQYAIAHDSVGVVDELIAAGADVKLATHLKLLYFGHDVFLHQLTIALMTEQEDVACLIVQKLIAAGAVSSQADEYGFTTFHWFVCFHRPRLVSTLLRCDPTAKVVINTPFVHLEYPSISPVVSAITTQDYATLAILLAHDVKLVLTERDWSLARDQKFSRGRASPPPWPKNILMPVEAAIMNYDEVGHLLLALGAECNISTVQSSNKGPNVNVVDWVRWALGIAAAWMERSGRDHHKSHKPVAQSRLAALQHDGGNSVPMPPEGATLSTSEAPGWKGRYCRILLTIRDLRNADEHAEGTSGQASKEMTWEEQAQAWMADIREYLEATEKSLVDHGAGPEGKLNGSSSRPASSGPPHPPVVESSPTAQSKERLQLGYHRVSSVYDSFWARHSRISSPAPVYLTELYDELFEACWVGDDMKIQELCLPKRGAQSKNGLLQIVAAFGDGCNPLSLALQARHWDTARLVLAIAAAQHQPGKAPAVVFQTRNIILERDDDDEDDDDDEEDEDENMETDVMDFVDIAKRPSTVQTTARPVDLLAEKIPWLSKNERKTYSGVVLEKVIFENDFEAFVKIAELYKALPERHPLPVQALTWILQADQPIMLDELIRRTGVGFNLDAVSESEHSQTETMHSKNRKTYLGLNVHGRKRADLATMHDPDASAPSAGGYSTPVLWDAAKEGALDVMKYLSGNQPVAAYQYYASTHNDERARYIRQVSDLAAILPARLGWTTNSLKESPLTAAVAADKLEALKALLEFQHPELQNALSVRLNYLRFNHIHVLATSGQCSVEMFEFLRANGIPVNDVDHRGWNILHWLCFRGTDKHVKLLEHVLRVLPEDMIEAMLMQQSRDVFNTPLHIAVKHKRIDIVQVLLSAKVAPFLLRDVTGSTVLHIAVKINLAGITEALVAACPDKALYMEDAVGNTPVEIATQSCLFSKIDHYFCSDSPYLPIGIWHPWPGLTMRSQLELALKDTFELSKQEHEIPRLRATIQALLEEGRLRDGAKLTTELLAFADKMETKLAAKKAKATEEAAEANPAEHTTTTNMQSALRTQKILLKAITERPGAQVRYLVHVLDVRRSVRSSINGAAKAANSRNSTAQTDGLVPETQVDKEVDKEQDNQHKSFLATLYGDVFSKDTYYTAQVDPPLRYSRTA
ncbi:ankyrin [Amylocystis lapponica]|nr:ankyrin [Amylocystis lapponica]